MHITIAIFDENIYSGIGASKLINEIRNLNATILLFTNLNKFLNHITQVKVDFALCSMDASYNKSIILFEVIDLLHRRNYDTRFCLLTNYSAGYPMKILEWYDIPIISHRESTSGFKRSVEAIFLQQENPQYIGPKKKIHLGEKEIKSLHDMSNNKHIAFRASREGRSIKTYYNHRYTAMKKMGIESYVIFFNTFSMEKWIIMLKWECFYNITLSEKWIVDFYINLLIKK